MSGSEVRDVSQNAGRCDWCGKPIDMSSGDELVISDELATDAEGITSQDVADAIADALERVGTPKDGVLADAIRENQAWRMHARCESESSMDRLYETKEVEG